ncbi:hypothetical protein NQ315_000337 [Exocentrus adspersus]|uniref:Peptidase S1 domain-containing protein n=1 Tax=Exocentrus adspersus TaxID=1586481 RepID=A0AAV8VRR4_9CUCU|nr:hypothetical protein NQ315_000337 [Exocentrus adspersus]
MRIATSYLLIELVILVCRCNCIFERIVGGREVTSEEFPYQLNLRCNGRPICGAVLISEDAALTAAHCIPKRGVYSVRAGSIYVDRGGSVVYIKKALLHPSYDRMREDYDLAVLQLAQPLKLSNAIKPVRLPVSNELPLPNTKGYVSGWGSLSTFFEFLPEQLRAVQLPIMSLETCTRAYRSVTEVTKRMFCAGYRQGGPDSCQGDSGGPFVVNGTLYGLVSWGFNCGQPGYPGVYTNIAALRSYIQLNARV